MAELAIWVFVGVLVLTAVILLAVALNMLKDKQDKSVGMGYMAGLVMFIILYVCLLGYCLSRQKWPLLKWGSLFFSVATIGLAGSAINEFR